MPVELNGEIVRAVVSTIVPESVDLGAQGWRDFNGDVNDLCEHQRRTTSVEASQETPSTTFTWR